MRRYLIDLPTIEIIQMEFIVLILKAVVGVAAVGLYIAVNFLLAAGFCRGAAARRQARRQPDPLPSPATKDTAPHTPDSHRSA